MRIKKSVLTLVLVSGLIHQGCALLGANRKGYSYGKEDKCGCRIPPEDVFITTGVDLQTAQSTINKLVIGGIEYKVTANVLSLASQAMIDERIRAYIRCSQTRREGLTPEQVAYFDDIARFLSTKPTPSPEQFIEYKKAFRFPKSPSGQQKTCEAGKNWSGIVWSGVFFVGSAVAYFTLAEEANKEYSQEDLADYLQARTVENASAERNKLENRTTLYRGLSLASLAAWGVSSYYLVKFSTGRDWSY